MPSASTFLLAGLALAIVLCATAWFVMRPRRSSVSSVDGFREALRAIAPREHV